ncbi:hypothetical protein Aperf_G00000033216 [Anoplocephala perfoliata]
MAFIKRGVRGVDQTRKTKSAPDLKKPISNSGSRFNYEKIRETLEDEPLFINSDDNNISSLKTGVSNDISTSQQASGIHNRYPPSVISPDGDNYQNKTEKDHFNRPVTESISKNQNFNRYTDESLDHIVSETQINQRLEQHLRSQQIHHNNHCDVSYFINDLVKVLEEVDEMDVSKFMLTTSNEDFQNMITTGTTKLKNLNPKPSNLDNLLVGDIEQSDINDIKDHRNEISESSGISAGSEASMEVNCSESGQIPHATERTDSRINNKSTDRDRIKPKFSASKMKQEGTNLAKVLSKTPLSDLTELTHINETQSSNALISDLPIGEGKLYWYFWIPQTQSFLFHNSKDRRIQSMARSTHSIIYLLRERRVDIFGEHQQLAVIIASSEFQMKKCKNLIDEKFPYFKVRCGSPNQPQNCPDFVGN